MATIWKASKYILSTKKGGVLLYLVVILATSALSVFLHLRSEQSAANIHLSGYRGLGLFSAIFLFVTIVNFFGSDFETLLSFNISRRKFLIANIMALGILSLIFTLTETTISTVLRLLAPYYSSFEQFYVSTFFIDEFVWFFFLFVFIASLGCFASIIGYKYGDFMQMFMIIALVLGSLFLRENIMIFIEKTFGLTNILNPYMAVLTFIICSTVCFGLSYLLVRRMGIRS